MILTIALKSRYEECDRIYEFLEQSKNHPGFADKMTDKSINDLKTVAEELFTNIVMHGYKGDREGLVEMELHALEQGVCLVISDAAPPYDPFARDAPIPPEADLSQGGMGLTLIRSMTDEQHYRYENGLNIVRLVKHPEIESTRSATN